MPTINIFYSDNDDGPKLDELTSELKKYVAQKLTCGDIQLNEDEVSVRLLKARGNGMIASVELEVTAAAFAERVEKQDEICLNIQKFLKDRLKTDIYVWLILAELGHSQK
ncbi:MAG: hypothetical protein WD887_00080 [Candidatus Saccharimonadales bacterium]